VTPAAGRAAMALALLVIAARGSQAQDTVTRHMLPIDTARIQPFRRMYDMVVHTRDSAVVIGQREVSLEPTSYANAPAWRIVETRTGAVPAAETLYVSMALRPLQWYAAQGAARVGATFVGDTVFGAISAPSGKLQMIIASRPDLVVSQALLDALMPLLPLSPAWSDSAGVLAVDMAGGTVIPSELTVIGEEEVTFDSISTRPVWVVALRAEMRTVLLWVDKENGEPLRIQQPLPAHVGTLLEYRRRSTPTPQS
jgi:hypothetical protein